MSLSQVLDQYAAAIDAWLEQTKKETSAVQRLKRAVSAGNLRDLEKLRQTARTASNSTARRAEACEQLSFDTTSYLGPEGAFLDELEEAAQRAGVRLYVRDSVVYCYPVLLRPEPDLSAVRIDRALTAEIRPDLLVTKLKALQAREPRMRPDALIESVFTAYEAVRALRDRPEATDLPLYSGSKTKPGIYEILTLLPGSDREYPVADFTRALYFLDTSNVNTTRSGHRLVWAASTVSRERGSRVLTFVTRDGHEKRYAAIKFIAQGGRD